MNSYPPEVYDHCTGCGFFFYFGMPKTHLGGCKHEADPHAIRRHQLRQLGLGLQRLLERVAGI